MPTPTFIESGTDATSGLEFWDSIIQTGGTVTSDATARTGPKGIKIVCITTGIIKNAVLADAGRRNSFGFRFNQTPSTTQLVMGTRTSDGLTNVFQLGIQTSGVLQLNTLNATANGSITLNPDTWYRICVSYTITNTTTNQFRVYVDGVLDITVGNATLNTTGTSQLRYGPILSSWGAGRSMFLDDIFVDDGSDLSDTGDIHVTAKLPAALNTNNFDTEIGSSTNRWEAVNERALSTAKGWREVATANVQENFGLQGAADGDVDISTATLVARSAWVWAKRGQATTRLVQSFKNNNKSAGTTLAITVSGATANNTYLIAFAMDGATGTISATDNASTPNTYVVDVDKAAASPGTGNVRVAIIRALITTTTSLTTITITHPSVTARAAVVAEFSGINTSTPLDKSTSAVGSGTAASSGATAATTQADEVIFGAIAAEEEAGTFTIGTGMTPDQTVVDTATTTGGGSTSNAAVQGQYALQIATSTQTANATTANTDWTAAVATYKATSGGSSFGTPQIMDNGNESAITLTTSAALYAVFAASASYPNNAAGVGMRSTNATPDTFFYEGGTLLAYIPSSIPLNASGGWIGKGGWF